MQVGAPTLYPDLVISVIHSPASPTTADEARFTATVRNVGSAPTGNFGLVLNINREGVTVGGGDDWVLGGLDPGESHEWTFAWNNLRFWGPGTYTAIAGADSTQAVVESDESNNEATDTFPVVQAMPDLVPEFTLSQGSHPLSAALVVRNVGTAPSSSSRVRWDCNGTYRGGTVDVPALAPGGSFVAFSSTVDWPAGTYVFTADADWAATVAESDETNNHATVTRIVP
jgi:subtilase family serine protease